MLSLQLISSHLAGIVHIKFALVKVNLPQSRALLYSNNCCKIFLTLSNVSRHVLQVSS